MERQGSTVGARPPARRGGRLGVRAVSHHDCLVTVAVVDKDSGVPLPGARVVMHPFRAVTDHRGFAELRVATGAYTLFVSQTRYLTLGLPVEVTADMTASAELCLEPPRAQLTIDRKARAESGRYSGRHSTADAWSACRCYLCARNRLPPM